MDVHGPRAFLSLPSHMEYQRRLAVVQKLGIKHTSEAIKIIDETLEVRDFRSIAATVKADLSTSEVSKTTLRGFAKLEPSGLVSL
jgi:hypothetical protein